MKDKKKPAAPAMIRVSLAYCVSGDWESVRPADALAETLLTAAEKRPITCNIYATFDNMGHSGQWEFDPQVFPEVKDDARA